MLDGLKLAARLGAVGLLTVSVAVELFPLPPSIEVTTLVVLTLLPAVAPVTVTLKMHCPLVATVAPDIEMVLGAVSVTVPPQTVALAFGTVAPTGRVSVNPTPVSEVPALGLLIVKVSDVVPPTKMLDGLKPVARVGADGLLTVSVAVELFPLPPSVDVTTLVVLSLVPAVAPVTVTLNWHCPLAAIVAPDIEMVFGAVSVTVPPQTVALAFGTVAPAGSVSVNPTPVSVVATLGLVIVKLSDEV